MEERKGEGKAIIYKFTAYRKGLGAKLGFRFY